MAMNKKLAGSRPIAITNLASTATKQAAAQRAAPQPIQQPKLVENPYSQMANPLAQTVSQHTGAERVYTDLPQDVFFDCGIIAYYIADLPPSPQYATSNDPVPSVQFLISNGEARKKTKWLTMSTGERSNLHKLFGVRIPNYQMFLEDERLFTTGFQCRISPDRNPKFSYISDFQLGNADVSNLFYDIEYVPLKFTKAWGQLVPMKLAVLKTDKGIIRLENDQMKDNSEYEAERLAAGVTDEIAENNPVKQLPF